jgi:hypothetical protein
VSADSVTEEDFVMAEVADVVTAAIREQRFYVLPCPNVPLEPGPGVARIADARPAPRVP